MMMNTTNMNNQKDELKTFVKTQFVGIDANIFMHHTAESFFAQLGTVLRETNQTCFTIEEVSQELERLSESFDEEKARKAKKGFEILQAMNEEGLIVIYEKAAVDKPFADAAWLSLFNQMRTRHALGFLSQDKKLCLDIVNHVNGVDSVQAHMVKVRRLNVRGALSCFQFVRDYDGKLISAPHSNMGANARVAQDFGLEPVDVDEGSEVYARDGMVYTIAEEKYSGSEAIIWTVMGHPELLLKQFVAPTNNKFEKVCKLCTYRRIPGAILPQKVIYDKAGRFVGYLMEVVNGIKVQSLFTMRGQKKNAPYWNRRDFVVLAHSIADLCKNLLNNGILVGDVSASNFMVGWNENGELDPTRVYAIDMDSVQMVDNNVLYLSEGITPNYAAPELLREGANYEEARRNDQFSYSVAVLTLQLVLVGIHPFRVCSDAEDAGIEKAMKDEVFPFGTNEFRRAGVAPSGVEKLWSNMPLSSKRFYYSIFQRGKERNAPNRRPGIHEIAWELNSYIEWLDDKENQRDYPEILSLDPQNLKPYYARCSTEGCASERFRVDKPRADGKYYCPACRANRMSGSEGNNIVLPSKTKAAEESTVPVRKTVSVQQNVPAQTPPAQIPPAQTPLVVPPTVSVNKPSTGKTEINTQKNGSGDINSDYRNSYAAGRVESTTRKGILAGLLKRLKG